MLEHLCLRKGTPTLLTNKTELTFGGYVESLSN
jgi:hypothetical protein